MLEREARRVQELPLQAEVSRHAVLRVAADGEADRAKVNADLVRAPRLEADAEERVLAQQLDDVEMRDGLARRIGVERPLERVAAVAADRRVDRAATRARPALHERDVLTLELAPPDELDEALERLVALRHDEQPRGAAIEAVHDPA